MALSRQDRIASAEKYSSNEIPPIRREIVQSGVAYAPLPENFFDPFQCVSRMLNDIHYRSARVHFNVFLNDKCL